ncbi:MAG: ATP-grasp domain-containing protein [Candidatus Eisenbacteria bacterium]|uniref:ATP-grasp domain-containing protein n=1 Tax=Eiseniibacteriota bacterium TaxID=2212470 RepID=A0A933SB16_UNCEI|nr:ATP-grasp domain-containing protein [Candidatus Eisenbacteria bacterium]
MKIAVVRNRRNEGVVARFGVPTAEKYGRAAVQGVLDALRTAGHEAIVLEGDGTLFARLAEFMPADPATGRPTGMVFNMAYGVQGECRYVHVPGVLESIGVPYTGSSPRGHAACLDKVLTKLLIEKAGVRTPRFCTMWSAADFDESLRFPLVVKPRHESTSLGLSLVHDRAEVEAAVAGIVATYGQDALVEEYVDGREVAIGLLGNDPVEVLPIVELDFGGRASRIVSKGDKFHKTDDEPEKVCPAPLDVVLERKLHALAHRVWRACGCRDYARIDVRIGLDGEPSVLEINSMASLGAGGSYMRAAGVAGYTFDTLVAEIVDRAHRRYFGTPAPRESAPVTAYAGHAFASELED